MTSNVTAIIAHRVMEMVKSLAYLAMRFCCVCVISAFGFMSLEMLSCRVDAQAAHNSVAFKYSVSVCCGHFLSVIALLRIE